MPRLMARTAAAELAEGTDAARVVNAATGEPTCRPTVPLPVHTASSRLDIKATPAVKAAVAPLGIPVRRPPPQISVT